MAPKVKDTQLVPISQEEFESVLQEQIRQAVRLALVTILEAEVDAFIGALPYERTPMRQDQRNGYYSRDLVTSVGRIEDLAVPRTRKGIQDATVSTLPTPAPGVGYGPSVRCSSAGSAPAA